MFLASVLWACGGDNAPAPISGGENHGGLAPGSTTMLQPFKSDAEFRSFTERYSFAGGGASRIDGALPPSASPTSGGAESGAVGHSDTNLQEPGVDEPDYVKTDGKHLYVAAHDRVLIVDAVPAADMRKVAEIPVHGYVTKLLLSGARLIVLYSYNDSTAAPGGVPALAIDSVTARSALLIADVSDPSAPAVERNEAFDGYLSAARRIDNALHLVLQYTPMSLLVGGIDGNDGGVVSGGSGSATSPGGAAVATIAPPLPSVPARAVADPLAAIPKHYSVAADGTLTDLGALVDVSQILHPDEPAWLRFVEVVSVDIAQPQRVVNAIAYLGDVATIYASSKALYLAQSDSWFGILPAVGGDVAVGAPVTAAALAQSSARIHKFALNGVAATAAASGTVPGYILNQYALSERNDMLRLATHDWNAATAVYVLQQNELTLDVIGKIENIAPGENLYAARFVGDRGFLVTFQRIDPLITLDLSNPRAPKLVGELKVPGFSQYLHPVDATHLLAVGRSTRDDNGRTVADGVQISLFDISDFAHPLQRDIATWPSGEWSDALYDPLAFNYWAERKLLGLPYTGAPVPVTVGGVGLPVVPTRGARVYGVDTAGGLTTQGQLTIGDGKYPGWARTVFVGGYVYYVSDIDIAVSALDAVDVIVGSVDFPRASVLPKTDGGTSPPVTTSPPATNN